LNIDKRILGLAEFLRLLIEKTGKLVQFTTKKRRLGNPAFK
jgi:hypothetical protein